MTTANRITFFRGDSHVITVAVKKRDNAGVLQPVDLTGATAKLSVKARPEYAAYATQLTCEIVNAAQGTLRATFAPADTQTLKPGQYTYDVQVTLPGTLVYTVIKDTLDLKEDVTRPAT